LLYLSITSFFKPLNRIVDADASCPRHFKKEEEELMTISPIWAFAYIKSKVILL
jgi:hypothetical protein